MKCDLHVHSCLSPCANISMVPGVFKNSFLDVIALCDHNSGKNVRIFSNVLKEFGKVVIPGIEIQTIEDVHILGYFYDIDSLENLTDIVYTHLPKIKYDPEKFGYQLYVNEKDEFIGMELIPLSFPTDLSLSQAVNLINKYNGIPVYAHISRKFGVLYQLGIFPNEDVKVVEVNSKDDLFLARKHGFVALSSSDAHFINQIGERYSIIEGEKSVKNILDSIIEGKVKTIWDL